MPSASAAKLDLPPQADPIASDLDIVPSCFLEQPFRRGRGQHSQREVASEIDGYLRRLARQDSLARRVLGRLAARFLGRRSHHRVGFARVGDYAQERLGIAARELQELARVSRKLDELPLIAESFERGELSWTRLRSVSSVATADNESRWLALARQRSGAELASAIAAARAASTEGEGQVEPDEGSEKPCELAGGEPGVEVDADADLSDGEPRARVRIYAPPRVSSLKRRLHELASRHSGTELCGWQAAEAIAAEGLSSRPRPAGERRARLVEHLGPAAAEHIEGLEQKLAQPSCSPGSDAVSSDAQTTRPRTERPEDSDHAADAEAPIEPSRALRTPDDETPAQSWTERHLTIVPPPSPGAAWPAPQLQNAALAQEPGPASDRNAGSDNGVHTESDAAVSRHSGAVTAVAMAPPRNGVGTSAPGLEPQRSPKPWSSGVDATAEDMQDLARTVDWSALAGALPADIEDLGVSVDGLDPHQLDRRMREVVAAMQRTDWQIGCLLRTFFDRRLFAELGFPTAADYVARRLGISPRKARGLVSVERKARDCHDELGEAYRNGRISWLRVLALLPIVTEKYADAWIERAAQVTFRRLAAEVQWARDMQDRTVPWWPIAPPPLGERLDWSGDQVRRQIGAHLDPDLMARIDAINESERVVIDFTGPASVMSLLADAVEAYRKPTELPWQGLERLFLHVKAEWENVPRHRNPIFERDGWRCRVPACTARQNLQDHHIVFRSRGGSNRGENRVAICAWHHLRGIHTGVLRAVGNAHTEIEWRVGELDPEPGRGVSPSGPPLMHLYNDVYAEALPRRDGSINHLAGLSPSEILDRKYDTGPLTPPAPW